MVNRNRPNFCFADAKLAHSKISTKFYNKYLYNYISID